MTEQHWDPAGADPWLISRRSIGAASDPVSVAGVSVDVGLLHQPTEYLGVAGVLTTWLESALRRVGMPPNTRPTVDVTVTLGEIHLSVSVTGPATDVARALTGFDELLAAAADVRVDHALRETSLEAAGALQRWSSHYAVRWPGYRPHLATLGPVALDAVDGAALGAFAAQVAAGTRVYWTDDPVVADTVRAAGARTAPTTAPAPIPPLGLPAAAGSVLRRHANELFSVPLPATFAGDLAGWVVQEMVRRRLTELEPLATAATIDAYDAGPSVYVAGCTAELRPGRDIDALQALVDLFEDLPERPPEVDIARGRALRIQTLAGLDPVAPVVLGALARRHLRHGDLPTVPSLLDQVEEVSDAEVRTVLADLAGSVLVAVPPASAANAPLPWAEPPRPLLQSGRRFADRALRGREVRCDGAGVGVVELPRRGPRRVPVAHSQVELPRVVLRIDTADSSTLVDDRFATVRLSWPSYRRAEALRALVDGGLNGVARIRLDEPGSGATTTDR